MNDEKITLEDILAPGWFDERITDLGSKAEFQDWWSKQIYSRRKEHEFHRVDKIITRYERFQSDNQGYLVLAEIDTEFPELFSPSNDQIYAFLPDACGEKAFRLSVFSSEGSIVSHQAFDDKESALRYAAKQGCTCERPGAVDSFIGTPALERSLVMYAAQRNNMHIDEYIMQTKDKDVRLLFRERIKCLIQWKREKENKDNGYSPGM